MAEIAILACDLIVAKPIIEQMFGVVMTNTPTDRVFLTQHFFEIIPSGTSPTWSELLATMKPMSGGYKCIHITKWEWWQGEYRGSLSFTFDAWGGPRDDTIYWTKQGGKWLRAFIQRKMDDPAKPPFTNDEAYYLWNYVFGALSRYEWLERDNPRLERFRLQLRVIPRLDIMFTDRYHL